MACWNRADCPCATCVNRAKARKNASRIAKATSPQKKFVPVDLSKVSPEYRDVIAKLFSVGTTR